MLNMVYMHVSNFQNFPKYEKTHINLVAINCPKLQLSRHSLDPQLQGCRNRYDRYSIGCTTFQLIKETKKKKPLYYNQNFCNYIGINLL